jgi:GntR family histidine utilization transcriptional repressor
VPAALNQFAPATLHQRIRSDIEAKIVSGAWPPGHRIPFEHELVETFSCSRMTVNKVMTELVRDGLVERRRRAGSFVARPRPQTAVLVIPDLQAEMAERGEEYEYELLARRRRRAAEGDRAGMGVALGTRLLALRSLHRSGGAPIALEDRLLNLDAVPEAARVDFAAVPPHTWLLDHVPWTDAENRITAAPADAATAGPLSVPAGTACLMVERRTWRGGVAITHVRQVFPGDRYRLMAHSTPAQV